MPRTIQRAQADSRPALVVAHDQFGRRIGIDVPPDPGEGALAHPVPVALDAGVMPEPRQRIGIGRPDRGEDRIADFIQRHQPRLGAGVSVERLGELGMGKHMVAARQDERRALAGKFDLLEEARQIGRADRRADDAAEFAAHVHRYDDRQDRLAEDEGPDGLAPARPVHGARACEQRVGRADVLARLRPHGRSARTKREGSPSVSSTTKPTVCGTAASEPSAKTRHCSRSSKSISPRAIASLR